jgi:16S rRNA (cytosine1402-N4)-methyltransferase
LAVKPGEVYLDCTLGSAGHALEIIKAGGRLYGLDIDPEALKRSKERIFKVCPNAFFKAKLENFSQLAAVAQEFGLTAVAGILLDLGLSSEQLADPNRGFSFNSDAPLDMRASPDYQVTAADLLSGLNKGELYELFTKLGEEQHSLSIADLIVRTRLAKPITTTKQLAEIVMKAVSKRQDLSAHWRIHPATKVFQALRIAVNDELNNLKAVLPQAVALLKPGGRLAVISFHSLEDRIVKNFIKNEKKLINLTKKPIMPSDEEIKANPRSRSAKLRVAEKL